MTERIARPHALKEGAAKHSNSDHTAAGSEGVSAHLRHEGHDAKVVVAKATHVLCGLAVVVLHAHGKAGKSEPAQKHSNDTCRRA